ncbi:MAG: helix-turn-helix domain-containing protein [Lachnospiraceae bacterium]
MKPFPFYIKEVKRLSRKQTITCDSKTIYYCKNGTCDYEGRKATAGDIIYHYSDHHDDLIIEEHSEFISLSFTGFSLDSFLQECGLDKNHIFQHSLLSYPEETLHDIETILALNGPKDGYENMIHSSFLLYRVLIRLQYFYHPQYIETKSHQRALLSPAFDLINSSMMREITTQELADKIQISRNHMNSLFHELTGFSPRAYVARQRLFRLKRELFRYPERSIKEIAAQCGFLSIPSFQQFFLKEVGMTPNQYRKKYKSVLNDTYFRAIAYWQPIYLTNTSNKSNIALDHFKRKAGSYRLYFVTEGTWKLTTEDGNIHILKKGDIYCNPPYRKNRCCSLENESHFFEVNFGGPDNEKYVSHLMALLCNNEQTIFSVPKNYEYDFIETASYINRNFWYKDKNIQIECSLKLYEILYYLSMLQKNQNLPVTDSPIAKAMNVINNPKQWGTLSIQSLADLCDLSMHDFLKVFKAQYHTTPKQYIKDQQMKQAARLLLYHRTTPIYQIASQVGYYSTSYFSSEFKKLYGMSPTQYRSSYSR